MKMIPVRTVLRTFRISLKKSFKLRRGSCFSTARIPAHPNLLVVLVAVVTVEVAGFFLSKISNITISILVGIPTIIRLSL